MKLRKQHSRSRQPRHKSSRARSAPPRRWSHQVMEHSDALDLEHEVFKSGNAREIALSLKQSATHSRRRKGTAFQSAMSMLNFYVNRAGRNLPKQRKATLQTAKARLREAFGRAPQGGHGR